jgi:di/tricarboxylate transporter
VRTQLALLVVTVALLSAFVKNIGALAIMIPIAFQFARRSNISPVAIGAGCDFLTPIGHPCNTLVMGPGGYRFSDYPRLGLPLSMIVVLAAVPLLMVLWPVR